MITAVLNGFRRPQNLDVQIKALKEQTISTDEILIWHNDPGPDIEPNFTAPATSAFCNANLGVWARFAYALNASSEYVCVFDDDTVPGSRWFENCLETMRSREALLGTVGCRYEAPTDSYHTGLSRFGWVSGNPQAVEVDFVGHAWFFKRAWLSTFWRELPDPAIRLCGEDMHFSAMVQKYLGVPTIVPPHPPDQKELWGSVRGDELGRDKHSLWESNPNDFRGGMDRFFAMQRRQGWRLVCEK